LMSVCCELTTRPEESYRLWYVAVCYRNLVNQEPNINQQWQNLRDLLAGGDLTTLGSLQDRLPASQYTSL
jgi:hypothetical protein